MTLTGSKYVFIFLIACSIYLSVIGSMPISGETEVVPHRIHLQTAPAWELELLLGIGPKMALKIVEYRQDNIIRMPDDLVGVHGIGQRTVDQLRRLTTQDEPTR